MRAQLDIDNAKVEKRLSEVVPPGALTAHGVYLLKKGVLVIKADMKAQGFTKTKMADVHNFIEQLFELRPDKRAKYTALAEENRAELVDPARAEIQKEREESLAKVRDGAAPLCAAHCAS